MTHPILPARSYEEALPYLRAPYQPNQIRALIINAPDNERAPCSIALYAIGETAMDRFNLVCANNWSRRFETVIETERKDGNKTFYYCQVKAIVVAFGVEHDDIGEAEAETRGAALMNARAQGWKRGGRWHGPGQVLYAAEQILLWRSDKDDELFVPKHGDDPHKHPYMKQGGQKKVRHEYQQYLTNDGEAIYGKPLDHLAIYREIARRAAGLPAGEERRALPPAPVEAQRASSTGPRASRNAAGDGNVAAQASTSPAPSDPAQLDATVESVAAAAHVERRPMPDVPAAEATVSIAESLEYTAQVARELSNLARNDGQTTGLTERQQSTVLNWLVLLSDLKLTSQEVLDAIEFVAGNGTTQESRQATFTRWLAAKTGGSQAADRRPVRDPSNQTATADATPAAASDAPSSESQSPAQNGSGETQATVDDETLETERALVRIHRAMASHGYSDRTVTQLAALAVGVGPKGKVDWAKVAPQTMQVLAELLESAASLDWTPDALAKEVHKAHNSTQQSTPAGRFSAFAGHLTDLAESRSVEAA
jgi:hypothetical protein